ncbi:RNA polymerase-binding protein RbpA [Agromyces neolithicus]|uniref:RNA polymerase-binding protein RbpA n=2 Tax=Agromyces neolithicus TaxID=269420 RepID=A0ABN2MAU4_9MICO
MGEQDRGFHADRIAVSYWDARGNETVRYFAANLPEEEIPDVIDSPSTGLPAGRDRENPPSVSKLEPYKTHLAYVKERRTEDEAAALLDDALTQLRTRRGQAPKD